MKLKYKEKLAEFDIKSLDDDNLDPAFVAKAKEFEEKLEKGSLSDEEITTMDNELCKDFDELHEFEEVDSPEFIEIRTQKTILEGKQKVESAGSVDELKSIADEYKDYEEVVNLAKDKAAKIQAEYDKKSEAEKAIADLKARIAGATDVTELKAIAEEHADNKEIVEMAKAKATELNEAAQQQKVQTLKEKLQSKKTWTFGELTQLGINPTGDDMVVEGVQLERVYLFKAYNRK